MSGLKRDPGAPKQAKRECRLSPALKQQIRWLTNRLHVAEEDTVVSENITGRMTLIVYTPGAIKKAGEYAIKIHRDNQNLFKRYNF